MSVAIEPGEERTELGALLSSDTFAKSPNLAKLLSYVCDKYFQGDLDGLKEYNIGVEALGRPPDFDPTTNSIVRVEAHRLRDKLKKFYENEGKNHALMITLQAGRYAPQFVRREHFLPGKMSGREATHINNVVSGSRTNGWPVESGVGLLSRSAQALMEAALWFRSRLSVPARISTTKVRVWHVVVVAGAALAIVAGITAWSIRTAKTSAHGSPAAAAVQPGPIASAIAPENEVRILAGYTKDRYVDHAGRVWQPDMYYQGGSILEGSRDFIMRTSDPTLYREGRAGDFSYDIPLHPGVYELRLFFAEAKFGPTTYAGGGESSRIFSIDMNGQRLLSECDVLSQAGGTNIALQRSFKNVTPARDGYLHLKFLRYEDQPFVNALEIVPAAPGRIRPVRIVAQETSFTDHAGLVWQPDNYYRGGRRVRHKGPVIATQEPDLYTGERYGRFDYSIPVAKGQYAVTLYFSETYFGTANAGFGGVGSRVFDVSCNGVPLLEDFDIFKEAHGANRAIGKTFHGLEPDAAGQLVISFRPVTNYACVNAIEVLDESP